MTLESDDFWKEMRDSGCLLINAPARKVAVFPNSLGDVMLAILDCSTEGIEGDCLTAIDVDEIDVLIVALLKTKQAALPVARALRTQYAIDSSRAKGKVD